MTLPNRLVCLAIFLSASRGGTSTADDDIMKVTCDLPYSALENVLARSKLIARFGNIEEDLPVGDAPTTFLRRMADAKTRGGRIGFFDQRGKPQLAIFRQANRQEFEALIRNEIERRGGDAVSEEVAKDMFKISGGDTDSNAQVTISWNDLWFAYRDGFVLYGSSPSLVDAPLTHLSAELKKTTGSDWSWSLFRKSGSRRGLDQFLSSKSTILATQSQQRDNEREADFSERSSELNAVRRIYPLLYSDIKSVRATFTSPTLNKRGTFNLSIEIEKKSQIAELVKSLTYGSECFDWPLSDKAQISAAIHLRLNRELASFARQFVASQPDSARVMLTPVLAQLTCKDGSSLGFRLEAENAQVRAQVTSTQPFQETFATAAKAVSARLGLDTNTVKTDGRFSIDAASELGKAFPLPEFAERPEQDTEFLRVQVDLKDWATNERNEAFSSFLSNLESLHLDYELRNVPLRWRNRLPQSVVSEVSLLKKVPADGDWSLKCKGAISPDGSTIRVHASFGETLYSYLLAKHWHIRRLLVQAVNNHE